MWIVKAWTWLKEHTFAAGAAVATLAIGIFSLVSALSNRGTKKTLEAHQENKKESDKDRAATTEEQHKLVEEFHRMTDEIRAEAKRKEKDLTAKQEKNLQEKTKRFVEADTPEERMEIVNEVKKDHPELNFVPLDSLVEVHND